MRAIDLGMPAGAPPAYHVLAKPTGAICNLDCSYCFFLSKEELYPGSNFRMPHDVLETYIAQLLESHRSPNVTVSWQGGEPTLMGLDFFAHGVELVEKYRRPNQHIEHTMQTNGTLIDSQWAAFLAANDILVGISIDGPRELHDAFRVDKGGKPTFDRVRGGLEHLINHGVRWNVLTTVNRVNEGHGGEVYRFLTRELGADFIQFIPIVEQVSADDAQTEGPVSPESVTPSGYGRFLSEVFDHWVRHDVGRVFVQMFDSTLASFVGVSGSLCVHSEICGTSVALEHTGDVYSCDHFVDPDHLLGNIRESHLIELVSSPQQRQFGKDKRDSLPHLCRTCDVRFACHGGCPKARFTSTPDGEKGLHYLCPSFLQFFRHVDQPMRFMASRVRAGAYADDVMAWIAHHEAKS